MKKTQTVFWGFFSKPEDMGSALDANLKKGWMVVPGTLINQVNFNWVDNNGGKCPYYLFCVLEYITKEAVPPDPIAKIKL